MLYLIPILMTSLLSIGLDDSPAKPGEWGFHPEENQHLNVTPPGFSWRLQKAARSYELELISENGKKVYKKIPYCVFCPDKPLKSGDYQWRYRYIDKKGKSANWSRWRFFSIQDGAIHYPLPDKKTLLSRIPKKHPRLFMKQEDLATLKKLDPKALIKQCEKILKSPPPSKEPPKYPKGTIYKSEAWRKIWWGNRTYTVSVLESAAVLAFTGMITDNKSYSKLAKKLLMDAAKWDPKGATGYRYNDEAGMPYAYHFSRTYTFLYPHLTLKEKKICKDVMAVRGDEIYRHLCPKHLDRPYSSHSNRAWHFLGEVGIAFYNEIPEAGDWVYFAANVFRCAYPVWSDRDGGWHEGISYWQSYMGRFTWWAAVMDKALCINAYKKPYFSEAGYYPIYITPPGQKGGGFGDLCSKRKSSSSLKLVSILAAQAQNPHWQWYVNAHGGASKQKGYLGFLQGLYSEVEEKKPLDLPTSRLFAGTGVAAMNTTLINANDNIQVLFKSSPFGTQSHGYDSQNSFLLNLFGERMLIRSGYRDIYGSAHHKNWMWDTKSVNSISVNGKGQTKHSSHATGEITEFFTSKTLDFVEGEAHKAYGKQLKSFYRRILFLKPGVIIIHDLLEARAPAAYTWHLHSEDRMMLQAPQRIAVQNKKGVAVIDFLFPDNLEISIKDKCFPQPRERVKLTQWHLDANVKETAAMGTFVTVIRTGKKEQMPAPVQFQKLETGFQINTDEFKVMLYQEKVQVFIDNVSVFESHRG